MILASDLSISPFLDHESSQRVATLYLLAPIDRCRTTPADYVKYEKIRGKPPVPEVCYLICGIICISFVIVALSTEQISRRVADICAGQAARAPTIAGVALGSSPSKYATEQPGI